MDTIPWAFLFSLDMASNENQLLKTFQLDFILVIPQCITLFVMPLHFLVAGISLHLP